MPMSDTIDNKSLTNILMLLKYHESDNFCDFINIISTVKTALITYLEELKSFDKKSLIQKYKNKIKKMDKAYKALQQLLNQIDKT